MEHIMLELKAFDQGGDSAASSGGASSTDGKGSVTSGGTRKTAKYWTEVFFTSSGVGDFSYSVFRISAWLTPTSTRV